MNMRKHIEKLRCIAEGLYAMANIFEDEQKRNIASKLTDYSCIIETISAVLEELKEEQQNTHEGND